MFHEWHFGAGVSFMFESFTLTIWLKSFSRCAFLTTLWTNANLALDNVFIEKTWNPHLGLQTNLLHLSEVTDQGCFPSIQSTSLCKQRTFPPADPADSALASLIRCKDHVHLLYIVYEMYKNWNASLFLFCPQIREITLLIFSYINSAHQQKAAAHHLSAPALMVAQPVSLKSKELRSKSPPALGRPSKAPTLLWWRKDLHPGLNLH